MGHEIRISDFGESKIMENQSKSTGIKGSPFYFPPEVLSLDDDTRIIASPKHDIWSLGILAHQMFADGQHPFKIPNSDTLWKKNVMDGNYRIDYKLIPKGSPIDLAIQGKLSVIIICVSHAYKVVLSTDPKKGSLSKRFLTYSALRNSLQINSRQHLTKLNN